ncbi:unnamed protein product [Tilletia controversa]|uniref:BRCT domain-containing protein n=3 Tax=Tilletia TaxID=13289 RepID=A0A8X7SW60_9BASI|nr:hypothetical protein CF328_g7949 [Tilletia controversa]KAE8185069.1 hypothetical protein CF335_g7833 [Tilletia laevis]KAE8243302.1 hypothetical protein A4X03_0g7802 [Tilletia caries]KAE8192717.1 hypothetical protein CF336_g4305 [Tilletia laevis]KAE8245796.1 hypothetical protein A4X06_0g5412 [Tilletia controversa]
MPGKEEDRSGSQALPSSQDWRQAAYASQSKPSTSGPKIDAVARPSKSALKTRSSTSQRTTQASGFLKSEPSDGSKSLSLQSARGADVGFRSASGSGSGLAALPLYSTKATDEIRSLTSKKGMQSEDNPITHSRMSERTQHYVSSATGHQVASRTMASFPIAGWRDERQSKLREQAVEKSSDIFKGVTAYLNGYQGEDQVNLDITRKIQANGGKVNYLYSKTQCTHIISSRALSGKKNQEWIVGKKKSATISKLVRPQWVYDSIAAGRRLAESKYPVFSDQTQGSILSAFGRKEPALEASSKPTQPESEADEGPSTS